MISGELKKLKIEAYSDIELTDKVDEFLVMFNPDTYTQNYEVQYDNEQGTGTTGTPQRFGRVKPQEYRFDFIFDGTGVSAPKQDVGRQIDRFLTVAGKLDSDMHRPRYLKVWWGNLTVQCVLKSAQIVYSLFKNDGTPLRAKVTASFAQDIDDALRVREENLSSPDLTHVRQIKDGDSLPLMTYKMYDDPSWYVEVARANQLNSIRRLAPGQSVSFPPIKQGKTS